MRAIAFTGNGLDRADELRADEAWIAAARRDPATRFLPFWRLQVLLAGAELAWLGAAELPANSEELPVVFLGRDGDRACFALDVTALGAAEPPSLAAGRAFEDGRAAAAILSAPESAIMGQGRALLGWHHRHGFCAVCGTRSEKTRGGTARRCLDPACAAEHFPRVDPVVIMLVTRGDYCLMGRQAAFTPGMYSALAGFIEPGETIEEAVRREVREEAGLAVEAIRYVCSQPWPFPSSLMIGCFAHADDERLVPDSRELEDLRWFHRDEVAAVFAGDESRGFLIPTPVAIAHHLLALWLGA